MVNTDDEYIISQIAPWHRVLVKNITDRVSEVKSSLYAICMLLSVSKESASGSILRPYKFSLHL
jgi:hypothetical protein